MMKRLCFVYLFSVLIAVSSNPLGQLVQSCNAYQPSSYSNPTSIPVVIQHPSNTDSYIQPTTVQVPAGCPGPLGDSLNQIVLNRILSNPSFQKIVDPNTKLYNQNGEEIQRQMLKGAGAPNVINNYFIVPPEFFNLNETVARNENEAVIALVDNTVVKKPHRRKLKRRIKKVELNSAEDDDVVTKNPIRRRKQKVNEEVKQNKKPINAEESLEIIDEDDESQEIDTRREQETKRRNKRKQRLRKKNKNEQTTIPPIDESFEDFQIVEGPAPKHRKNKKEIEIPQNLRPKSKTKIIEEVSDASLFDQPKRKKINDDVVSKGKVSELIPAGPLEIKTKKEKRKESSAKQSEPKVLKNIEIPTDISYRERSENRKTRDSKRNAAKKEPEQKLTPFPDDVLNNFFPYMPPVGNLYNSNSNYPYNFDQYYQYLNPGRNSNAKRNKTRRKNRNRKNKEANSNTHTIEIKLKPKTKENITETVTTEKPKDVSEVVISIEVEQSTESFEQVTDIPMEMPHKVTPIIEDKVESSSKESYETFSKLEKLQELITPELGKEDEVPAMNNNGIINDYYPVFDDDVYYSPYVETVKKIDEDRYFYDTGVEGRTKKEKRKFERYEDSKNSKRDNDEIDLKNPDIKTKSNRKDDSDINKYDHNEYLDHIAQFSDTTTTDTIKSSAEIIRVKVPPKNTRIKTDNVETIFAGSKVAKYGVSLDKTFEDSSTYVQNSDESSYSGDGQTTYVVAKSLGPPEDYW